MADATAPDLVKARLVPYQDGSLDLDTGSSITVQFNPTTLKVGLENEIKADAGSKKKSTAAQHIEKRASTLAVELIFDTSLPEQEGAVEDVRKRTARIADTFMKAGKDEKTPKRLCFQWGTFAFDGIIASYQETLDFFSPEGVPLRSTVALSIKEDQYQFAFAKPATPPSQRQPPTFVGAPDEPVAKSVERARASARDWRDSALASGIENPRAPGGFGVSVAHVGLEVSAGGFSVGASASLGTAIPGAFAPPSAGAGIAIGVSFGI